MAGGSLPSTENDSQKDSREARSPNLWLNRVAQRSSTHSSALDIAFRFIDGMTILFGNAKYSFQDELSSRPERSGAEGSAVRPSGFPNSGALTQTLKPSSLLGLYGLTKVGP
jgi:hypothetical protein